MMWRFRFRNFPQIYNSEGFLMKKIRVRSAPFLISRSGQASALKPKRNQMKNLSVPYISGSKIGVQTIFEGNHEIVKKIQGASSPGPPLTHLVRLRRWGSRPRPRLPVCPLLTSPSCLSAVYRNQNRTPV